MEYTYTTHATTAADAAGFFAVIASMMVFLLFAVVIGYVIMALVLSQIFKKAGVEQWIAWVPIYNSWKTLEIGGQHGWWIILAFIPVVNIVSFVMLIMAMYNIGLKLGKQGAFVLWGIFIPIVWYLWLAFDSSTWDESKGAPRVDTPTTAPAAADTQNPAAPTDAPVATSPSLDQPSPPSQPNDTTQTPPTTPAA